MHTPAALKHARNEVPLEHPDADLSSKTLDTNVKSSVLGHFLR